MLTDIREGFAYLASEKGLLAIGIYFTFNAFAGSVSQVITLPYFKQHFPNGEYDYLTVWVMMVIGRTLGGLFHYRLFICLSRNSG